MTRILLDILLWPLRILIWPFRRLSKLKQTASTVRKTSGGFVANQHTDNISPDDALLSVGATGLKTIFFKELERPRLSERTASDLTLEEAKKLVGQANEFYTFRFSLFPRSDFFYEEIEQDYLREALGQGENSSDARFTKVMSQFRKTLNDNSRRLFLYFTPAIFAIILGAGLIAGITLPVTTLPETLAHADWFGLTREATMQMLVSAGFLLLGLLALMLLYHWPYKVTQQRNLLGLDNYITSRFARINQNFLVAKRNALNVERNMRMPQAEQLKEEAGIWTLTYQWFAMRLLLCELLVRNNVYQVRRNTTLYSVGGVIVSLLMTAIAMGVLWALPLDSTNKMVALAIAATSGLIFTLVSHSVIMGNVTRETMSYLQSNEWSRFHSVELHKTIADHVGEDKLQIVTFRDRNRFE